MKLNEFERIIKNFFKKQEIKVSDYAMRVFESKKYLSRELLDTMVDEEIEKNVDVLLVTVSKSFQQRKKAAKRVIKVRDIDVRPVIRREFCRLPPFCKRSKEKKSR